MKKAFWLPMLLAFGVALGAQQSPRMTTVEPGSAKAGEILTANGENLDKAQVAEVYLTDGKKDFKVQVTEQAATAIKFKVPKAAPGRFSLMLLTTGKDPKLIEQPVRVTVEE